MKYFAIQVLTCFRILWSLNKRIKSIIKLKPGIKTLERLKRTSRGKGYYGFRFDSITIRFINTESESLLLTKHFQKMYANCIYFYFLVGLMVRSWKSLLEELDIVNLSFHELRQSVLAVILGKERMRKSWNNKFYFLVLL